MRKKAGIVKKIFTLLLIFSLSINSFAAIVSDNDGSAFITKAEFDALKSTFQAQIDSYNQSIDSKIDGAIASYLSGIKISTNEVKDALHKWEDVVFMNGNIAPEFALPRLNMFYNLASDPNTNMKKNIAYAETCYMAMTNNAGSITYNNSYGSISIKRALCKAIDGDEISIGKIYWDGVALQYQEYFQVGWAKVANMGYQAGIDNWDWTNKQFTIANILRINPSGYITDHKTYYNPACTWKAYDGAKWVSAEESSTSGPHFYSLVISATTKLGAIGGKTKNTNHLIQYNKDTEWCLSNENWLNRFRQHPAQTQTATSLYNASTKSGRNKALAAYHYNSDANKYNSGQVFGGTLETSFSNDTTKLSSVGMLPSDYAAKDIYQFGDNTTVSIKNTSTTLPLPTLEQGLELTAQADDVACEWEVQFGDVVCYNGTTKETNNNEVDVYLSYVPFTDVTTSSDYVQLKGVPVGQNYITTLNRRSTIKWDNTKAKCVYVKCVPHWLSDSQIDKDWSIALDLSGQNGQIKVTKLN